MKLLALSTLTIFLSVTLINCVVIDEDYADSTVIPDQAADDYTINATHTRLGRLGGTVLCLLSEQEIDSKENENFNVTQHFNGSLCTHAMFAYASLCGNSTICGLSELKGEKVTNDAMEFGNIAKLKNTWPNLHVGVSIGGYHQGSQIFSNVSRDLWSRFRFVKNVITKLKNAKVTAVEFAWFAPTIRYAGKPEDRQNYVELIKEFRKNLSKLKWHFGVAIKILYGSIDYYDIHAISPFVDWIRVETHGLHIHWEDTAGLNAPLYGRKGDRKTVAYWIHQVAALSDAKRVLLEVPFYGRPWLLDYEPVPGGPGSKSIGLFTNKAIIPYHVICETIHRNDSDITSWKENWDPYSMTPWAIKERQYFSYDNERSIKAKVEFAKRQNLAGVSIQYVGMDDFDGKCGRGKMPLLNAVQASIASSLKA